MVKANLKKQRGVGLIILIFLLAVATGCTKSSEPEIQEYEYVKPLIPVSVDLTAHFNKDSFSYLAKLSDGDFDGEGYAFAADLVLEPPMASGVRYTLGPLEDGKLNTVLAVGQTIELPKENIINLGMLASSAGDHDVTIRMNYADGTSSEIVLQTKDWWNNNTTDTVVAARFAYNHRQTQGVIQSPVNIFAYYLTPEPGKELVSVTLPNDDKFNVFAMAAIPEKPKAEPRVMPVKLSTMDVAIAEYNVLEFGAIPGDDTDDTDAFLVALQTAGENGGGVVFAPAGQYTILGNLRVPTNVTLRGDWASPDNKGLGKGTILMAYADKGKDEGKPFMYTEQASTVRDLSIWYPEQSMDKVQKFPWTIFADPDRTVYGPTIKNVTLVNSYQGIRLYGGACSYLQNVYGTILKEGVFVDHVGDIVRLESLHLGPTYWAESGLGDTPSVKEIRAYTQKHATGIIQKKNDWGYMYDVSFDGFHIGVKLDLGHLWNIPGAYNGQIDQLQIKNTIIGMQLDHVSEYGIAVSNSSIETVGTDGVAIWAKDTMEVSAPVSFNNSELSSPDGLLVKQEGNGTISFVHSTFNDWGDGYAIEAIQGSLILEANTFKKAKSEIHLGKEVSSAVITANKFNRKKPEITSESTGDVVIDFDKQPDSVPRGPTEKLKLPEFPKPKSNLVFNVKGSDFGAIGDGSTDDTTAFQNALDVAAKAGGGTIYVPPGRYVISGQLRAGAQTELRGISDGPHHYGTSPRGSVLVADQVSSVEGTPFITLGEKSGIRGLSIFYPDQSEREIKPYPITIVGEGKGNYVVDTTLPNAYDAMKMTQEGYYINYVRGLGLNSLIQLEDISGAGTIMNLMNTVGDWQDLSREENAPAKDWWMQKPSMLGSGIEIRNTNNVLLFNNFSYGIGYPLRITGSSDAIRAHGFGADNAEYGIELTGSGTNLLFTNTQLVSIGGEGKRYIYSSEEFSGEAQFYIVANWAASHGSEFSGSGKVILQQYVDKPMEGGNSPLITNRGGELRMDAAIFQQGPNQVLIDAGAGATTIHANIGFSGFGVTDLTGKADVSSNVRK